MIVRGSAEFFLMILCFHPTLSRLSLLTTNKEHVYANSKQRFVLLMAAYRWSLSHPLQRTTLKLRILTEFSTVRRPACRRTLTRAVFRRISTGLRRTSTAIRSYRLPWQIRRNIRGNTGVRVNVNGAVPRRHYLIFVFVLAAAPLLAYRAVVWKDPSPHSTRYVTVEKDVRLEVLDWGGSGMPIVLLAGGGDTAHVFDEFAPKLTAAHHVYGITRRGFGASGYSALTYGADRLGDDVLAIVDYFKLDRPVLVGHSLAGEELSSIASRHRDRVAGLIYLEAAYPYAFDNGKGPTFQELQGLQAPQPPSPRGPDLENFNTLQTYFMRVNGFRFPEAELREQWDAAPDGRVMGRRNFPGYATLIMGMKKFTDIRVPALVVFANPHSLGNWVDNNTDPAVQRAAHQYSTSLATLVDRQEHVVENVAPAARVVTLPGAHHYVFLSNEGDVLHQMNAFLVGLRQTVSERVTQAELNRKRRP